MYKMTTTPQPKIKIFRSDAKLKHTRQQPCIICGETKKPRNAHHVRKYGDGGTALKPSDSRTVAVCRDPFSKQRCHDRLQAYEKTADILLRLNRLAEAVEIFGYGRIAVARVRRTDKK